MDTQRHCSICGKPLAASAPEGLCPECLIKAALGTGVDPGSDTKSNPKQPAFNPPAIAELAGKFPQLEVLEFVGQGGMGAVYKARQKQLNRIVALKILPPQAAAGPGFAERFAREARALARLNHPHIVTLYEFGQADGLFYFLMEFVDGVNLRQLLHANRIAPKEALAIVPQICEALQFAHDEGIVHRDIKPENILLDKKGQVKIADFGVAKIVAEGLTEAAGTAPPPSGELTAAGSALGTPQYMAPEQIKNSAEVDHRADIYSLGVVFYQMLTGELPAGKIEPPSKKVTVDVRLDEIVLRALEKKPELRYQQASVLKTEVETIADNPAPAGSGAPTPLFLTSFGLVFRSRAALYVARAGWILGCLAALGFLGFIPGSRHLKGLFGFAGFFGLVGVAILMEFIYGIRHPANRSNSVRRLPDWRWVTLLLLLIGLFVVVAITRTIKIVQPTPEIITVSTFGEFTNLITRELDRINVRFDNLYISSAAPSYGAFSVSFKGLQQITADNRVQDIDGSLEARHPYGGMPPPIGAKWEFQGMQALSKVHFGIDSLDSVRLISPTFRMIPGKGFVGPMTPDLNQSVTAVAAHKGEINVYIGALGEVESSNTVSFTIAEDYVEQVVRKFDAGQKSAVEAFDRRNEKFGHGTLIGVDNQIDVNTGTLKCKANLIPENGHLMIPGLILNVRLLVETRHNVTLVPVVAVQHDAKSAYVWVINSDHTITRRGVKTGAFENDVAEIQDGLAPGEMVVTDNFNKLQEGATVSVGETPASQPSASDVNH